MALYKCLIVHYLNAQISSTSEHKIEEIIYLKDKKLKVGWSLRCIEDILAVFFPLELDRAQFATVQAGPSKHLSVDNLNSRKRSLFSQNLSTEWTFIRRVALSNQIGRYENRPAYLLVFARLQNSSQYKRRASPDALFAIFVVVQIYSYF